MKRFFDFSRTVSERPIAAALHYDPLANEPPEVLASGRGVTAQEIVRIAKERDIPLHQDAGLVEALARLDASEYIPRELYAVVAEILAYVYKVDTAAR
ncbi:MAG: EscU/YscU/HrcU family type III secretion system export apparatus switch protein [Candidatus Eremiobacteraeota bacterium]|nr:EscU/YscU/HrcU family type III secretion system export apparatus switch protein [Candidatus Eremiobacteraeota bacterium]